MHFEKKGGICSTALRQGASRKKAQVDGNQVCKPLVQGACQEGSQLLRMEIGMSSWDAASKIAGLAPDILPSSARKIEEAKVAVATSHLPVILQSLSDNKAYGYRNLPATCLLRGVVLNLGELNLHHWTLNAILTEWLKQHRHSLF